MKKENFSFVKGDTFVKGFTPDVNQEIQEIYFTVKETSSDKNYVIQKTLTTGILKDPNSTNRYIVKLRPEDTNDLKVNYDYIYDIQVVTTAMKKTIMGGYLTLEDWDITSSINEDVDVTIDDGEVETYVLPVASENTLGGIKVGANLTIGADGTLNAVGEKVDLSSYAKKSEVPTKTSQLTNDSGYLTKHQDISNLATKNELHSHNNKTILDGISQTDINNWDSKSNFSGNYGDLTNKPTIPTKTSQLTNDSSYVNESYVTNAINNAQLGGGSGNVDLSNYATKSDLSNKVDKVSGKSLIADTEIERLKNVTNYDDTEIKNTLNSKANTSAIPTKTSQLTNDSGFLTAIPSEYVTETDMTTYIEEHKDEFKGEDAYIKITDNIKELDITTLDTGIYLFLGASEYAAADLYYGDIYSGLLLNTGTYLMIRKNGNYYTGYIFEATNSIFFFEINSNMSNFTIKEFPTKDYVTSAINNAIGNALGGSY